MNWRWGGAIGNLVGEVVGWMLGRTVDAVTGGDPLDPRNDARDEGKREADPVFPQVKVKALIPRDRFRDVIERIDAALERGFRETQKEVLRARAAKQRPGEVFVMLCNVFHDGFPSGLQIAVGRTGEGENAMRLEGRGPAMGRIAEVLREEAVLMEQERDGVFHAEEGVGWVARIPAEHAIFLGQVVTVVVEEEWSGLPESGDPADSEMLKEIIGSLNSILAGAERGFQKFVDDAEVINDVSDPVLVFPSSAGGEDHWYLQISRSNWPDFRWRIQFEGDRAVDVSAGG